MDEFDNMIEKYRRELMEFSKNNPTPAEKCSAECNRKTEDIESYNHETVIEEDESVRTDGKGAETISKSAQATAMPAKSNMLTEDYKAPQFDSYADFISANPQNGLLRVQVFAAGQAFPIANARVTVALELKNESHQIFDGLTDINGIVDNIKLPAPSAEMSQTPSESAALPYSSYTTYVEHPDFVDAEFINVPVFAGIKSIQSVELIPNVNVGNQPQMAEINEGESFTRLKGAY